MKINYSRLNNKINGILAILKFDNWLAILIDRLLFKTPALIYSLRGLPILIDHAGGDCGGTRDVLVTGMYEKYLAAIGLKGLKRVIDIGANGGGFSLCLLLHGAPVESLVCVEMNPNTFMRLQYNVTRNRIGLQRHCLNAAVAGYSGYLDLRLGEGSAGDSLANALVSPDGDAFRVQAITLTQIVDQYFSGKEIDLCKIDIEGGEYELFGCADETTFAKIRYILVELHPTNGYAADDGVAMLNELGFSEVQTDSKYPDVLLFKNLRF